MIVINKQPGGNILNAYNNCIIEFTSDENINSIARALVTIEGFTLELTPIAGIFYVNLKNVITTIINQKRFEDEININYPSNFLYLDNSLFHELNIDLTIKRDRGVTEEKTLNYSFFKSVKQIFRTDFTKSNKLFFLTKSNDNIPKVTCFDGYPFDLSVYSNEDRAVTVRNIRTASSLIVNLSRGVNRLFLTNGQLENCGFNCLLPLYDGINELEFLFENETVRIDVTKKDSDCGIYLKWFNQSGAWSYWRLHKTFSEQVKTSTLNEINSDFKNIEEANNRNYTTGKDAAKELICSTGKMNQDEYEVFQEIFSSPKIYLYNSEYYQSYDLSKWIEVDINAGTYTTKDTRKYLNEVQVKISLPQDYTQTYVS